MHFLALYQNAKLEHNEAAAVLALIGKRQNTTAEGVGKLHSVTVNVKVHYQPTDGAKNYHDSKALDAAMSEVVSKHWGALRDEAMALLAGRVAEKKAAAAAEYKAEFGDVLAA